MPAHNLSGDCPTCRALAAIPHAPTGGQRHPFSDPQQQARKELTQCQSCFKSKAEGAKLFKCSACKVDLYCVSLNLTARFSSLILIDNVSKEQGVVCGQCNRLVVLNASNTGLDASHQLKITEPRAGPSCARVALFAIATMQ